jgi:hypothetical protein
MNGTSGWNLFFLARVVSIALAVKVGCPAARGQGEGEGTFFGTVVVDEVGFIDEFDCPYSTVSE